MHEKIFKITHVMIFKFLLFNTNHFGAAEINAEDKESWIFRIFSVNAHYAAPLPHIVSLVVHQVDFACAKIVPYSFRVWYIVAVTSNCKLLFSLSTAALTKRAVTSLSSMARRVLFRFTLDCSILLKYYTIRILQMV